MRIGDIDHTYNLMNRMIIIRNYLVFLLFCLVIHSSAFSQFTYYDHSNTTNWEMINQMVESGRHIKDSLQESGYTAESFSIFEIGDQKWMTIDGRFDVFQWEKGKWKNIYKGNHHGYNYNSQKFLFDNKLFSYRGYGFWKHHGEIVEFLPLKGSWEIIPETMSLPFGIGYVQDSTFYIHAGDCFHLDLKNDQGIQSASCHFTIRNELPYGKVYNFQDYILVASILEDGAQFPLIKKETGEVFLSHKQPFKDIRDNRTVNSLIHIKGNEMTIVFPDSSSVEYDIENELQYYFQEPNEAKKPFPWYWWVLIFVSVSLLSFAVIRHLRKPEVSSESDRLLPLKKHAGRLIDSDELDKILGVDEIPVYETRKYKRASLIQELNALSKIQSGHEIILREKNPEDKRFYLYRIQSID